VRRVMEPYFARHGVSGSQWAVLRTLVRAENDGVRQLRLTDLGDRLLIRPPSVTGVVDRLQKMGLVARVASPTDQRVKNVSLTVAGRKLVRRVLQHHAAQVKSVLAGLSPPEQQELHRLLGRLGSHLEQFQDGAGSSAETED
jgi:DNA-binding MarR family transcriptional regulator